jgi:cytochrome c551/c552
MSFLRLLGARTALAARTTFRRVELPDGTQAGKACDTAEKNVCATSMTRGQRCPRSVWAAGLGLLALSLLPVVALDIQLPPETGTFKQDAGAEIANGQCLICHSVEYVSTQPPMARAFWKSSIQKMQQKYAAPIPDSQVEPLADYLTKNYGVSTNAPGATQTSSQQITTGHSMDGPQIATKYGCLGCHNTQMKLVGPAYREIAAKYKADPDAVAKIDQQIHKGGSGKWGPIIMPPFPQISAAETKALADWILGMK